VIELDYAFMTMWVRWAVLVLAVIYVITESMIFAPLRVWITKGTVWRRTLFYCPACMGFWIGVLAGVGLYWPFDYGTDAWSIARECFESGLCACIMGAAWSHWHNPQAFMHEAELRGEDPDTFLPVEPEDADEAEDDSA